MKSVLASSALRAVSGIGITGCSDSESGGNDVSSTTRFVGRYQDEAG